MLDIALALASRGLFVFPLTPGGKTPAIPSAHPAPSQCRGECGRLGHGLSDATCDHDVITTWWSYCPAANIGINCGASGLYVIDLDTPKPDTKPPAPPFDTDDIRDGYDALALLAEHNAEPLPMGTATVRTGRGGHHLYYLHPACEPLRNTAGKLGWLIDTRGVGGYVVAPGSIVDGNPYTVIDHAPFAPLPRWIHRLCTPPKPRPRPPRRVVAGNASAYARAVLHGEITRVLSAPAGTRNDTLNAAAFALGRHVAKGTMPRHIAEQALQCAADDLGGDTAKSYATIGRALADGEAKGRP